MSDYRILSFSSLSIPKSWIYFLKQATWAWNLYIRHHLLAFILCWGKVGLKAPLHRIDKSINKVCFEYEGVSVYMDLTTLGDVVIAHLNIFLEFLMKLLNDLQLLRLRCKQLVPLLKFLFHFLHSFLLLLSGC